MDKKPTVLNVDDHPVFRMALRHVMADACCEELDSFDALKQRLASGAAADLVLLDLSMPGVDGFSALLHLRAQRPGLRVAVVSAHEQHAVIDKALQIGACAYVPKSLPLDQLASALRSVLAGESWAPQAPAQTEDEDAALARRVRSLSPQQLRVLMALADGRLNKQIGADPGISEATAKFHITALLQKLELNRRTQLAMAAQRVARMPELVEPLDRSP